MAEHLVFPFQGVDDVRFGMSPQQVHGILGEPLNSPSELYGEGTLREVYEEMLVDYADNQCDFIHVFSTGVAVFEGIKFGGGLFREAVQELLALDEDLCIDLNGCISFELGIGFYMEDASVPDAPIDAVAVFPKGHYGSMEGRMRSQARLDRPVEAPPISGEPIHLDEMLAGESGDVGHDNWDALSLDVSRPIVCGGVLLTGQPYWNVASLVYGIDEEVELLSTGLRCRKLGVAVFSKGALYPSARVNGVIAVRENGWKEARALMDDLTKSL